MKWQGLVGRMLGATAMAALLAPARGDGLALKQGRDTSQWRPLAEKEQLAAIHHADGVQRMLLAIGVEMADDERAAWIFPVRGPAERVRVEIADRFPRFIGKDPRAEARAAISRITGLWRCWALPPLLLLQFPTLRGGLQRYHEVNAHGVHAEVVTAHSGAALAEHLGAQSVDVAREALVALEPYFTAEYALVVVWITSAEQLLGTFPNIADRWQADGRWPCVFMQFPTPAPFFPLRPTAAYGAAVVPLRVYAVGLHTPVVDGPLANELNTRHFHVAESHDPVVARLLGAPATSGFDYTLTTASVAARTFTHDLSLTPTAPAGWAYARFLGDSMRGAVGVFFFGLFGLSYISGGLAGLVVYRRWSRPALLGVFNVLTVFGLLIAVRDSKWAAIPQSGATPRRGLRRDFVLGFLAIYVLLTVLIGAVVSRPLG